MMGEGWGGQENHVWLYTHWGASNMIDCLRVALEKAAPEGSPYSGRWKDFEYLTRIVFCTLVGTDNNGILGYGINGMKNGIHGDVSRYIDVDVPKQEITVYGYDDVRFRGSFKEFVETQGITWSDDNY